MANLNSPAFTGPTFLALDTRDGVTWLYVSEHGDTSGNNGGRILKFNLTAGGAGTVIAPRGTGDGQFISPDGIVVDPDSGDLFIADRFRNNVQRITNTGTFVMKWGSSTSGAPDEMDGPIGLARDSTGAIYVTEHDSNFISKYTISGTTATREWRLFAGTNTPYGIAVSGSRIFFSDGFNARVHRWDFEGNAHGFFALDSGVIPLGIFADSSGLWIAEGSLGFTTPGSVQRVTRFTTDGALTGMRWGTQGTGNGQFSLPFHAVVDAATNRAYVADWNNNRVQVFDLGGTAPAAPVITSSLTATVDSGAAFNYTITATNSPTSYSALNLPTGLSVNSSTGVITGSTTVTGTHDVTIQASNAGGTGSATLVLTVNAPPLSPPVIESPLTASVQAGAEFSYTITATNSPTSYNALNLPAGLSVNTTTGVISGSTNITGSHDIALEATNAAGTGTATLTLTVGAAPTPAPSITSPLTASATAGAEFTYTITATNSPTSFDATGLPTGLSVNTATGAISGATTVTGSHDVTISATNAGGTGSATLTLTVNAAPVSAPVITSPLTASVTAGAAFSYTITASNSPTSFSATDLPAGLNVNTTTGEISGSTTVTGSHDITIGATNAGGTGTATLTLTVNPAATPAPVINSSLTASVTAGDAFSYTITATNSPTSFSATGLPTGLSVNTTTGEISGSTTVSGSHDITIGATNAGGTGTATLVLTVNPAPIPPPVITSPLSATVTAGASFNYTITATNSPSSFSATGLPAGLSINTTTGEISGSTTVTGSHDVTLGATNAGGTGTATLTLTVDAAPIAAPVIDSPLTASVTAGASFTYTITATNSPTSFSATGLPAGLTVNTTTGVISGSTTVTGSHDITIGATNAGGTGTATLTLTVNATPVAEPEITSPLSASVTAGASFSYTITASNSPTSFSATGLPAGLSVNTSTGVISGSTTVTGSHDITIGATNAGGTGTAALTLTVDAAPVAAPEITSSLSASIEAGASFSYTITATNSPTSFNATGLPDGLSVNTSTGVIAGSTTVTGSHAITISATNAGGTDTETLTLSVDASVPPPPPPPPPRTLQTITFLTPVSTLFVGQPITLNASASSGLPIAFAVISGNATLKNGVLTANAAGDIVVRAVQGGNSTYAPAESDVTFTAQRALGQHVYFGKIGDDDLAAAISADGRSGLLITRYSATGEALIVKLAIELDGTFANVATSIGGNASVAVGDAPHAAAATPERTFTGRLIDGAISGNVAELGATFSAAVQPSTGSTSAFAGSYTANAIGSASSDTYLVVGPSGQVYALVASPTNVVAGLGTISSTGEFTVEVSPSVTVTGKATNTGGLTGTLRMGSGTAALAGLGADVQRDDRLINVSSRLRVSSGDSSQSFIAGFVLPGAGNKQILIRGVGPTLANYGVTDAMPNPRIEVYNSKGALVLSNDDWGNSDALKEAAAKTGAFELPADSRDAALLATLPAGPYTVQLIPAGGPGSGLIEIYDTNNITARTEQPLINLSSRGFVGAGEAARLTAGFVVLGNAPKKILIRGVGPTLTSFGVAGALSDPRLVVQAQNGTVIAQNDNWGTPQPVDANQVAATSAELTATATTVGAFALPAGSNDAAVIITLMPGIYTASVTGVSNATGAALVEVYEIPNQ